MTENKIDYRLEDGTSTPGITASQWLSDTYEESRLDFLEQGKIYARIRGRLSRWGRDGKNEVKVISIRKSTDPHEIYFHILETFFATKYIECGPQVCRFTTHSWKVDTHQCTPQLISVLPHPQNSHVMVGAEPPESDPQITTTGDIPPVGRPINDCSTTTSKRDKPPESDFTSSTLSSRSRDPLSHLDVLQRGIILQILDAPPHPDGVHVGSIARGIAHMGVNTEQVMYVLFCVCQIVRIVTRIAVQRWTFFWMSDTLKWAVQSHTIKLPLKFILIMGFMVMYLLINRRCHILEYAHSPLL